MKTAHRHDAGPVSLMAEILAGVPALSDAACVGRERLFDPAERGERPADVGYRHRAAARLCSTCPALDECRAWSATQPDAGAVLAGVIPTPVTAPGRPRRKAS